MVNEWFECVLYLWTYENTPKEDEAREVRDGIDETHQTISASIAGLS